jgi:hypothetical protein
MRILILICLALLMGRDAVAQDKSSCARAEHVFVRSSPSPDTRPIKLDGATVHVDRIPIATSADLTDVSADPNDKSTVRLKYGATAAERLTRATTNNAGARLAFLLDDEVLLLVTWQGEFGFTASGVQLSFGRAAVGERVVKALEPCVGNAEIAALFKDDQAMRTSGLAPLAAADSAAKDAARRTRVRELLESGALNTANDFYAAAFIFQHGQKPEDYLLAHVFGIAAQRAGRADAAWISAATLDRYLHATGKAQILGTQFRIGADAPSATQEPFDSALVPDVLRAAVGVPALVDQQKQRQEIENKLRALPPKR